MNKFWETSGNKLVERLIARGGTAFLFWAGGVLAWAQGVGFSRFLELLGQVVALPVLAQLALVLGALVVTGASGIVVDRLVHPVTRLLEGYWPRLLRRVAASAVTRRQRDFDGDSQRWQELAAHEWADSSRVRDAVEISDALRHLERAEMASIDARQRHRPGRRSELMPTRIGNILRAAELRPVSKYGLDTVTMWPRLWLVMPKSTRDEIGDARAALDRSVCAVTWGILFLSFVPFTAWALVPSLVVVLSAQRWWVPQCAAQFGELVEAAFDLHRFAIYDSVRWPLPNCPAEELDLGRRLTSYLIRGSTNNEPTFRAGTDHVSPLS